MSSIRLESVNHSNRIAVVIPCYRVKAHILEVLAKVGAEVGRIFVVDDCCPDQSGEFVRENSKDERVSVMQTPVNSGVGGATLLGFEAALKEGFTVVVKVDGDGQIDPRLIPALVRPLLEKRADYSKGNRFYALESLKGMPTLRLVGNSVLSFINKAVSGYWNVMDPTNGFIAIHTRILQLLPTEKIEKRYFFESDMLFRLNTIRAVVTEIPMDAVYQDEESNLRVSAVLCEFPQRYLVRFFKRVFYTYYLRDFNVCSIYILSSLCLLCFGVVFGLSVWLESARQGVFASEGTVMLAALPVILGFQSLLAAVGFDVQNVPKQPLITMLLTPDE